MDGLIKDHTGKKFNRLVAIKRVSARESPFKKTTYLCKCDCGKELLVRSCNMVTGTTKSCGCLEAEIHRKTKTIDCTGQRFGRWLALERIQLPKRGVVYKCVCDCGKEGTISTGGLRSGNSQSCGCLNIDKIIERNHDPELILKRITNCNNVYKVTHWNTKKKLSCKGKWERNAVRWFNKNKIDYDWQVPFKLPDGRTYIIDLYDKVSGVYIEVKGWWRDDAKEKFDLFKSSNPGLKVEVWDMDELKTRKIPTR
jgi:hypothetical protein